MREIDDIIIHCTATRKNRPYTVEDIRRSHLKRGFDDIGYHYLIYLDGTVHVGRPIEIVGAHAYGHNQHSIGVCYVGGLDRRGRPCNTLNRAQERSLVMLIKVLQSTPPELYSNIVKNGIWLAGGGSLLRGIAQRFTDRVNIQFHVAEDPLKAVARGTCLALKGTESYPFLMR